MIFEILTLISKVLYYYPIKFGIFFFICLIWIWMYQIYKYKVSVDYKIYWPKFNWLANCIYLSLYIILLIILRYYTWGKPVDLQSIFNKLNHFLLEHDLLLSLFLFTLWVLFFVIMLRIRTILTKELIKRHIWAMYLYYRNPKYRLYFNYIEKYINKYSYRQILHFKLRIYLYITSLKLIDYFIIPDTKISNKIKYIVDTGVISKLHYLYRRLPFLVLVILFIYDCYYNSWIITKVFYYLPFYLIFNLWYKSSNFLCKNYAEFDRILHEMYYCRDIILYVGVTKEEFTLLETYINKGFKYTYTTEDMLNDIHPIIYHRRFTRIEEKHESGKLIFNNRCIGYDFLITEEDLKEFEKDE